MELEVVVALEEHQVADEAGKVFHLVRRLGHHTDLVGEAAGKSLDEGADAREVGGLENRGVRGAGLVDRPAHDAAHFFVAGVAEDQDVPAIAHELLAVALGAGNDRAGGVDDVQPALLKFDHHAFANAVGGDRHAALLDRLGSSHANIAVYIVRAG